MSDRRAVLSIQDAPDGLVADCVCRWHRRVVWSSRMDPKQRIKLKQEKGALWSKHRCRPAVQVVRT